MKKLACSIVIFSIAALAGCTSAQQANTNAALANLNQTNLIALQTISNGCKIVQPTLVAASVASPELGAAAGINAVVCTTAAVAANAASAVVAAQAPATAAAAPVAASQ